MRVSGIIDGKIHWLNERLGWTSNESDAANWTAKFAAERARIINSNNRFLDREERVEAEVRE